MTAKNDDLLELLNFELGFIQAGGYGRSVRAPQKATSIFQDSLSCLNFGESGRPHPCSECLLIDFVPAARRSENVPCHHIPLDESGTTIEQLEQKGNQERMEDVVKLWLRKTTDKLEKEVR